MQCRYGKILLYSIAYCVKYSLYIVIYYEFCNIKIFLNHFLQPKLIPCTASTTGPPAGEKLTESFLTSSKFMNLLCDKNEWG